MYDKFHLEIMRKFKLGEKEASELVLAFTDTLKEALLSGEKITLPQLCTMQLKRRKQRVGVTPQGDPCTHQGLRFIEVKLNKHLKKV